MDIEDHAEHTLKLYGVRGDEIHKWIDGHFDAQGFHSFLEGNSSPGYDPFGHRHHRHFREALQEAYREFSQSYDKETIKNVFMTHLRDDYDGYVPSRGDFNDPAFLKKYHSDPSAEDPEEILAPEELARYFSPAGYKTGRKISPPVGRGFLVRITLPAVLAAVVFIVFIFSYIIPSIEEVMLDSKKEMIQELANAASSVLYYYIDLEKKGVMTREKAQAEAVSELEKMRYGIDMKDYYWITDFHPRMIMHPYRPELIGRDLTTYLDREDKSGKALFKESVDIVEKQGSGYITYLWQWMDDEDSSALKLSYVTGIDTWDWILGTGVYINDIEEEISDITIQVLTISLGLFVLIAGIVLFLVFQTRKIEQKRRSAETGLKEAKERYRSLVEAANEAYILIIDGTIVYTNETLHTILGYSSEEVHSMDPEQLFSPDSSEQQEFLRHVFHEIREYGDPPARIDAALRTRSGHTLPAAVNIAKVFFIERNGFLLTIRKQPTLQDSVLVGGAYQEAEKQPSGDIIDAVTGSTSRSEAMQHLHSIASVIVNSSAHTDSRAVRTQIHQVYSAFLNKLIELETRKSGEFPWPFTFLHLGSSARKEMTFHSDQDNALLIDTSGKPLTEKERHLYLNLGRNISTTLHQAGFSYCPGGIMASNPQWCLTLDEWKNKISSWPKKARSEDVLELNIAADIAPAYGPAGPVRILQELLIKSIINNPSFMALLVKHMLTYSVPTISGILAGKTQAVNIKECLKPYETAARLLAFENSLFEQSTEERIAAAFRDADQLRSDSADALIEGFNTLWNLRIRAQLETQRQIREISDELDVTLLDDSGIQRLKKALQAVKDLQTSFSFRYFGNAG